MTDRVILLHHLLASVTGLLGVSPPPGPTKSLLGPQSSTLFGGSVCHLGSFARRKLTSPSGRARPPGCSLSCLSSTGYTQKRSVDPIDSVSEVAVRSHSGMPLLTLPLSRLSPSSLYWLPWICSTCFALGLGPLPVGLLLSSACLSAS